MSESIKTEQFNNLPESKIKPRSKFSIVWLVPIIAILIGSWLAYKAWSEMGPEISISFKTADGLEAGKTKIKYKNVEIGVITTVEINPDTHDIEVKADMEKKVAPFLTDKTSFWVVTARVNASGASGLGTLLSGAYINVDPNTEGKKSRKFTGLEIPPVISGAVSGKRFILHSKSLGSITRDAPVFYRKFNVGRVEDVKLNDDGQSSTINIFIKAPYDKWVNTSTKFWNSSGVDVSMSASGFNIKTESLVSILIGGISFDSDKMTTDKNLAENNAEFTLFKSQDDTIKSDFSQGMKFVINFSESVRGLTVGAPVEFRGIQLGEVTDIQAVFDPASDTIKIPVTIEIDNSKIIFKGGNKSVNSLANRKKRTNALVERGLRSQLETGNLLTGQLYVSLDFFPDAESFVIDWNADIPELPSVHGTLAAVKTDITGILKKVDTMMTQVNEFSYKLNNDLEPQFSETLKQVNAMMVQVKELSYKLNHNLEPELTNTLKQVDKTLIDIQVILENDSPLQQDLHLTLQEFTKAAASIKNLTDYLERHPESLLKGK